MDKVKESAMSFRGGNSGVKYLFRGPKIDWGVILLLPGQSLGGHYHREVEETFYVLDGQATLVAGGARHPVVAGDAVRLAAPEGHDLLNESEQPVKLVFIKCPYLPEDKVSL